MSVYHDGGIRWVVPSAGYPAWNTRFREEGRGYNPPVYLHPDTAAA